MDIFQPSQQQAINFCKRKELLKNVKKEDSSVDVSTFTYER